MNINRMILRRTLTLCAVLPLIHAAVSRAQVSVASPDKQVVATIMVDSQGHIRLNVTRKDQMVLAGSTIGIRVDDKDLGSAAVLGTPEIRNIDETYPMHGGHSVARNHATESIIPVTSGGQTKWSLEVRAYDDGVAYRYRVPGSGARQVMGEASEWVVPEASTIWFQPHNNRKDYEAPWATAALAELPKRLAPKPPATTANATPAPATPTPSRTVLAAPALLKLPGEAGYVMMTEANLVNYSDMALEYTDGGRFKAFFHNDVRGFQLKDEITTPWRVTLIAPDLNTLVNSDLIRNLCPPPAPELASADWIKPGRSTWHWMVVGRPVFDDQKQWVDWTSALGFEYYLIDDGWKRWNAGGRDMWENLKQIVDYAAEKNVGIWAWVDSKDILTSEVRQAYFERARALGIKGVKIDFMKPANTEWVTWYDETIRDAGNAKLMLNFHGALRPTGRERTYPHELTREAVRGRENGKQPGAHDTTLPFVRYVQGAADYTPTDFRTGPDAKTDKLKGSSYAHELSMAVVFTTPFLCYGGAPENYLQNEAVDILKSIPATWDETRVLPGSAVGEVAAFARRKGQDWFIGVINDGTARSLPISLSFLGQGKYDIVKLADSADRHDAFVRSQAVVGTGDTITVDLRKDGGFVAKLTVRK
ncbi:MAG: glycoside hydrolase family 97 catalytic domain-containing protein [Burkholderiales bacterium]|nr:glycoside hydrolase family 97 catalytic domain-containing protein [Phycisphaerae bacterium]